MHAANSLFSLPLGRAMRVLGLPIILGACAPQETGRTYQVWLPRNGTPTADLRPEIRVALFWDVDAEQVVRQFGVRKVTRDDELHSLIRGARQEFAQQGLRTVPVIIDAHERVPWRALMALIELCQHQEITPIEFALGMRPPRPEPPGPGTTSQPAERAGGATSRSVPDPDPATVLVRHREVSPPCERLRKGLPCWEDGHWVLEFGAQPQAWAGMEEQLRAVARRRPEPSDPARSRTMLQGLGIPLSSSTVVICADPGAPYGHVQRLIEMCGSFGIYKIEVGALAPPVRR